MLSYPLRDQTRRKMSDHLFHTRRIGHVWHIHRLVRIFVIICDATKIFNACAPRSCITQFNASSAKICRCQPVSVSCRNSQPVDYLCELVAKPRAHRDEFSGLELFNFLQYSLRTLYDSLRTLYDSLGVVSDRTEQPTDNDPAGKIHQPIIRTFIILVTLFDIVAMRCERSYESLEYGMT
jgi:hypothetical protein